MRTGEVKLFRADKGFGFIRDDQGGDTFFHISVVDRKQTLEKGDRVQFEVADGDRGPKASRVIPV